MFKKMVNNKMKMPSMVKTPGVKLPEMDTPKEEASEMKPDAAKKAVSRVGHTVSTSKSGAIHRKYSPNY